MVVMKRVCPVSGKEFGVAETDREFYDKMGVPVPTLCPEERMRRRLAWRPSRFFLRTCDGCGERVFSYFDPRLTTVVAYCEECYRSDEFDATVHGRSYDFSRPFFDQFSELSRVVPRHTSNAIQNENSEYILCGHRNKNCYMADEIDFSRECFYGYNIQKCQDIVEGLYVRDSEIGYRLVKAENCYNVHYSRNVFHCSDSAFLANCRSCRHCLFSTNLRQKEYYVYNQPVSKAEYERLWGLLFGGDRTLVAKAERAFGEFALRQPVPAVLQNQCEDCTGSYLTNSKNVRDSFCCDNCQDCRYCWDIHFSRDCMDVNIYEGELMYESLHCGPQAYENRFSILTWHSTQVTYCLELNNCSHLFGCRGLKRKQYCVLNKQYSAAEYADLSVKVIEHMKSTGEWGEFFPIAMSPVPYNQTMAQDLLPLTPTTVGEYGARWLDPLAPDAVVAGRKAPERLPAKRPVELLTCVETGRPYPVTGPEWRFYTRVGVPLPMVAPEARMRRLWRTLGERRLYDRRCAVSGEPMLSTYSPERTERVLSVEAYLQETH